MQHDFDRVWNRKNSYSMKWDGVEALYGEADLWPMWVADMDFKAPKPVIDAIKKQAEHGIFGYTVRPESYDEAVVAWFEKRHCFTVQKDWLVFSPGVVPALHMIVETFTNPGDKIIIQPPVYYPFFDAVKKNGRTLVENPLAFDGERYTIDFADLEQKLKTGVRLLIFCSPHNPVGRVWTRGELHTLGELCMKHDVLIVSDEVHCDLVLFGHRHIPFASLSERFAAQSITCTAPSKTFNLAGLQASNIIIPNEKYRRTFQAAVRNWHLDYSNSFAVPASEAAYRYGEAWLEQLIEYVEGNVTFLTSFIAERMPQIKVVPPEGTYLVWLDFRALGLNAKELRTFLRTQAKVALNDGTIFGASGEGFARINVACPRRTLEEGLKRIERAVRHKRPVS